MLLRRPAIGRRISDTRLAERDIGKRRTARRGIVNTRAAQRGDKPAVGDEHMMNCGAQCQIG